MADTFVSPSALGPPIQLDKKSQLVFYIRKKVHPKSKVFQTFRMDFIFVDLEAHLRRKQLMTEK